VWQGAPDLDQVSLPEDRTARAMDDAVVVSRWEELSRRADVMRNVHYHDATSRRRVGDGSTPLGCVVAQFNHFHITTKRAASTTALIATPAAATPAVTRPFNPAAFNFNKVRPDEVVAATAVGPLFVNVNPLLPGHSLFVPEPPACHPQVMTPRLLRLGAALVAGSRRVDCRIGFNSLCAWASVNHFHMHLFYTCESTRGEGTSGSDEYKPCDVSLWGDADPRCPLERVPLSPVGCVRRRVEDGREGAAGGVAEVDVHVAVTEGWPIPAIVFRAPLGSVSSPSEGVDVGGLTLPSACAAVSDAAGDLVAWLSQPDVNIAFNLLVTDAGRAVYVLPRRHQGAEGGGAEAGQLAVALAEMCGLAIVYSQADCDSLTAEGYAAIMTAGSLAPADWERVVARATGACEAC